MTPVSDEEINAYIEKMPTEMKEDIARAYAMNEKLFDLLAGFCKSELRLRKQLDRIGDTGLSAMMALAACRQNLLVFARFVKAHELIERGDGHHGPH